MADEWPTNLHNRYTLTNNGDKAKENIDEKEGEQAPNVQTIPGKDHSSGKVSLRLEKPQVEAKQTKSPFGWLFG